MKTLAVMLLLMATGVVAADGDGPEDAVVMSPAEHRFLVRQFMNMDAKIKELQHKLDDEKERTGCT